MIKSNEKDILFSYLNDCNTIVTYCCKKSAHELEFVINHLVQYERPDMYSILNKKLIIIEHFEFDSYKASKKGSDLKHKEGAIKSKFDDMLKERQNKGIITYNDTIMTTSSKDNYINNFKTTFTKHYNKISSYKENLQIISFKKSKIYFFIEDVSLLGSYYITNNRRIRYLLIFQFQEIINFLDNHKDVDGIIYGFFNGDKKKLIFVENNKKYLNYLVKDHELVDELDCYWFEPNVTSFSIPIMKIEK